MKTPPPATRSPAVASHQRLITQASSALIIILSSPETIVRAKSMNGMKIEKQAKRQHKELCHLVYTLATAAAVSERSSKIKKRWQKLPVMSGAAVITWKPFASFNYSKRNLFICLSFAVFPGDSPPLCSTGSNIRAAARTDSEEENSLLCTC